ncbi:MAG: exodeoxyribonuclease VII large, partial [Beijerinckiaceae bacterium]
AARLARDRARFDGLNARLKPLADRHVKSAGQTYEQMKLRLSRAMQARLTLERRDSTRRRADLDKLGIRLKPALELQLNRKRQAFSARAQLLESLGYRRVLARGYAVIRDERDGILHAAAAVEAGQALSIEFADGRVGVTAGSDGAAKPPLARPAKPRPPQGGQGSLF